MNAKLLLQGALTLSLYGPLASLATPDNPKNIILMIGDGMGPAYTSAYRLYKDNPKTEVIETTVFDRLLVGGSRTSPARTSGYVTDSAAAATSMSTGVKTYNGAIALDEHKQPLETLLEKAKAQGKVVGIAATARVYDATPASFLAHNEYRRNYSDIAEDYLDSDADVILGGGREHFPPALVGQFRDKGYQYLEELDELPKITSGKVLGLFAKENMPWAIDQPGVHGLSRMTTTALSLLSQHDQGFVLVVEGSAIDWAGHRNDITTAMVEMDEFAKTIELVERFVADNPNTLMVVTADHETGGMSVGAYDQKAWNPDVLRGIQSSPEKIVRSLEGDRFWKKSLAAKLGFAPTDVEWELLAQGKEKGGKALHRAVLKLIDSRSNTGWTTNNHSAVDVQVFAKGKGYEKFSGSQDNTEIAKKLAGFLKR